MMAFHVGQEVVCINDHWRINRLVNAPIKGQKYIIREICLGVDNREGLRLEEISNNICVRYIAGKREECEPHFWSDHFRHLKRTSQEISFTTGADPESTAWDRKRKRTSTKERA